MLPSSRCESTGSVCARPKSRIFTRPSSVRKMFSGLRSRCTIDFACAADSPSATSAPISTARRQFIGALHGVAQRLSFEQLGDEIERTVLASDVMHGDDVRMRERGDGARLPLQPRRQPRHPADASLGQDLDRDVASEPRIACRGRPVPSLLHRGGRGLRRDPPSDPAVEHVRGRFVWGDAFC